MHISRAKWKSANGKVYESIYLRESYREGGKVKKRQVANLTHCTREEVAAIELALKHKDNLSALCSVKDVQVQEGLSVGAVWTLYETARRIGIEKVLGQGRAGKLALWQVIARVLEQGSRLSAVRLAKVHAACDVLGMEKGFDENHLYENLTWLNEHQEEIEEKLFSVRRFNNKPHLFLYDVTSSYLEGDKNALAAYGYNRDGKKGKKQIVIGLLCDEQGAPVSTEVFRGNTQDPATFASQVRKVAERFGCERVTLVGDRGMIKTAQVEQLAKTKFHYITAITKPQIRSLLKLGVLQMTLFDESVCEVEYEGVRYVLRRNPIRGDQLAATRADKEASVEMLVERKNTYLAEHPRATVAVAAREVQVRLERLKIARWLGVTEEGRCLSLKVDEVALEESSRLDGCYVLKSDVPRSVADAETIHDRYRDLAQVEQAFRVCKTAHLEIRPVYVRKEANTRGHVLVVMLAYLLRRELSRAWTQLDVTVEEGLEQLKTLCCMQMEVAGGGSCLTIPKPRPSSQILLKALGVTLPEALPHTGARVVTRTKLPKRRKTP
jgi:hypothetical protein